MELKTLWQVDVRQRYTLQTVCLLTHFTEEVRMLVVVMLMTMTVTELVFSAIAAAFDGMYQMVFAKECQGTEHIRFVDGSYPVLQFSQRLRQHRRCQSLHHNYTVGGGLNIMLFEQSDTGCFVHFFLFCVQRYVIFGKK